MREGSEAPGSEDRLSKAMSGLGTQLSSPYPPPCRTNPPLPGLPRSPWSQTRTPAASCRQPLLRFQHSPWELSPGAPESAHVTPHLGFISPKAAAGRVCGGGTRQGQGTIPSSDQREKFYPV